jgi:hypothetical protein
MRQRHLPLRPIDPEKLDYLLSHGVNDIDARFLGAMESGLLRRDNPEIDDEADRRPDPFDPDDELSGPDSDIDRARSE